MKTKIAYTLFDIKVRTNNEQIKKAVRKWLDTCPIVVEVHELPVLLLKPQASELPSEPSEIRCEYCGNLKKTKYGICEKCERFPRF